MISGQLLLLLLPALASCQSTATAVSTTPTPVGSVSYRDASLQVFELAGLRFVEPFMAVRSNVCLPGVVFDQLAGRHALRLPMLLEYVGLPGSTAFSLTRLEPTIRGALQSSSSALSLDCSLDRPGEATLTFWCDSFDRCQQLRWAAVTSQQILAAAILVSAAGVVGQGSAVTLTGRRLQALPLPASPGPCGSGSWVLFQQRVDGSLSFQQNWDTYVRGFGHPDSNYWIGLDRLSAETLGSFGRNGQCWLRIEVIDVNGTAYWAESMYFQVYGAANTYMFYIGASSTSSGSLITNIFYLHSGMPFFTYDRDTLSSTYCSTYSNGCSKTNGYGGWWYSASFRFNLNALYTDKYVSTSQDGFNQVMVPSGILQDVRTTKMFYKC